MSTSAQLIVQIVTKGGKESLNEVKRVADASVSAEESALKRKKDLAAVWLASTKADTAEQKRLVSELVNAQKEANADAKANAFARSKVERDTVNEIIFARSPALNTAAISRFLTSTEVSAAFSSDAVCRAS